VSVKVETDYEDEYDIEHNWGDWKYDSDDDCQLVRTCWRCDKTDYGRKEHQWNDKICERCGKEKGWFN
jgi:hypothetical protein